MNVRREEVEDIYTLSHVQAGMLFHTLYAPESGIYLEQSTCKFRGNFQPDLFIEAWRKIVRRHPVLRTLFLWKGVKEPLQVVKRVVDLPVDRQDWRGVCSQEQMRKLEAFLDADRQRGFELSKAPLMRLALLQLADDVFQFVLSFHHLLFDGWAGMLIQEEVFSCYEGLWSGESVTLSDRRPYRDYIAWLQRQDMAKAEKFWRRLLSGWKSVTSLRVDPLSHDLRNREQKFLEEYLHISEAATTELRMMARGRQLTLNTVIQGAWALLLSRYSGQSDVVFGAVVSGRPAELVGAEAMIGLFINTLPVRVQVRMAEPVSDWLSQLQREQAEARQYDYSPLVEIQGWSEAPRGQPLFESLVVFENYPAAEAKSARTNLTISDVSFTENVNYPLTVAAIPDPAMSLRITYDKLRFRGETIRRMLGHLGQLLEEIGRDPEQRLGDIELLTAEERVELLERRNPTAVEYPKDKCAHELFEERVRRSPEAVAVVAGERELSYRQLNERSNALAHYLRQLGVGPEVRVGICMERCVEMIVALLGIWKAGGAFVPLDPVYPRARLEYMIGDAGVRILLTQQRQRQRLTGCAERLVCLDADWGQIAAYGIDNPASLATSRNLSYVMYTSGSTGEPKGVLIAHRAFVDHNIGVMRRFGLNACDITLQLASLNFDVSLEEMLPTWLAGGRVILQSSALPLSAEEFFNRVSQLRVTVLNLPASYWQELARGTDRWDPTRLPDLRLIIVGSERIDAAQVLRWQQWLGKRTCLFCAYGCTEGVITSLVYESGFANERPRSSAAAPLGSPLSNRRVYVCDESMSLVPIGVPGDLYLAGEAIARGYANLPELTAASFVPDPFSHRPGARMYRTGDRVRYVPDPAENLDFLGRIDDQVKVRGCRVELGEVEAILRTHPKVQVGVVSARGEIQGEKRLLAYVVPKNGEQLKRRELRAFLRYLVPAYMVPQDFVILHALPLTTGGKVDRSALPEPDEALELETEFTAPRDSCEEALAQLWADVLKVDRVGSYDHFFELGGHSLLAMQVAARIEEYFKIRFSVRNVFDRPVLADQAAGIQMAGCQDPGIRRFPVRLVPPETPVPLTPAQEQLWKLSQRIPNTGYFNIAISARLRGSLNVAVLEESLTEIVRRHGVLRTKIAMSGGQACQVVTPPPTIVVPKADLRRFHDRDERARMLARSFVRQGFDLAEGPLWRTALLRLGEEDHGFVFTIHHIICDDWSINVFARELETLYAAFLEGTASPLEELPVQYKDFAVSQRLWLRSSDSEVHIKYWRRLLESCPITRLPADRGRPTSRSFRYSSCTISLSLDRCEKIEALGNTADASLFMTLLAGFCMLLHRYGNEEILLGASCANRDSPDLQKLMGLFVNTFALRIDLCGDPDFHRLLRHVRGIALGAYEHQDLPFEALLEMLTAEGHESDTVLFPVLFIMRHTLEQRLRLEGVQVEPLFPGEGNELRLLPSVLSLIVEVERGVNGMVITFRYDTDLFEESTAHSMIHAYWDVLSELLKEPKKFLPGLSQ